MKDAAGAVYQAAPVHLDAIIIRFAARNTFSTASIELDMDFAHALAGPIAYALRYLPCRMPPSDRFL